MLLLPLFASTAVIPALSANSRNLQKEHSSSTNTKVGGEGEREIERGGERERKTDRLRDEDTERKNSYDVQLSVTSSNS